MKMMRKVMVLCAAVLLLLGLSACEKVTVQINDGGVITELETTLPKTVEKILDEAEIVLNEGDEVSPSLDTKISEAQEIVVSRKITVTLTVGEETKEVVMVGGKVSDLLEQEGITLAENQHTNYELDEYLTDGMEVKVFNLLHVEIQCDGETAAKEVEAATVGDALTECGITLGEDDRVTPDVTEAVTEGMQIVVNRVTFDTVVETETVAYETTYENDSSLAKGKEQTSRSGENGEKEITYKVTYVDGAEESKEVVDEKVTKEPVNAIVKVGTKATSSSSGSGSSSGSSGSSSSSSGKTVVSKKAYYDCDGSGHGYYEITYSDGSVAYEDF